MSVGAVTQVEVPVAAYVLWPATSQVALSSGEGALAEGAGRGTHYSLRQPTFAYVVRVPKTQQRILLRVDTKRQSEQEQIEKANDSIERFGRIFFW